MPQERLPSVPGSEEFEKPFGNLQEKLESENERAGRRPARSNVSEENRSRSSGSLPHWSRLYVEVGPRRIGAPLGNQIVRGEPLLDLSPFSG